MKQHVYNPSGTRQLINSGWKLFDEQTNLITTGNVSSNTQQSSYIRPWMETECNGRTNPEGHLTNFDLHPFRKYGIPPVIDKIVSDKGRKEPVILYMFHVWSKDQRILPFCWVLTAPTALAVEFRRKAEPSFWCRLDSVWCCGCRERHCIPCVRG